ncbi:MAG: VOC family protein [Pseudobdellovibrionaceae bacterium]
MQEITPCLWFNKEAEEAARFYTSLFPPSKIDKISHYGEAGAKVSGREKGSVMKKYPWAEKYGGRVDKF